LRIGDRSEAGGEREGKQEGKQDLDARLGHPYLLQDLAVRSVGPLQRALTARVRIPAVMIVCPAGRPPCLGAAVAAVRRPVSDFPVWGCFAVATFGAASLGRLGECMRMVLCGQPTMPGADQRAAHG
jgi:hypothetical protein